MSVEISKAELRKLLRLNRWNKIGEIFSFTPKFHFEGQHFIDWKCIPESMLVILRNPAVNRPKSMKKKKRICGKHPNGFAAMTHQSQGGICHYCKKEIILARWSVDHITPLSRGGSNRSENKIGCCKTCNNAKGNMTEEEFMTTPVSHRKNKLNKIREMLLDQLASGGMKR